MTSRDGSPENLIFESRFESGNLMKAVRVTDKYYELHLRPGTLSFKLKISFYCSFLGKSIL